MTINFQTSLQRHRFTVTDFHRMGEVGILSEDDRLELIDGEIFDMPPIGSQHGGRVKHLNRLLSKAVGESAIVSVQNPIILGDHSEPEPDLALLRPRPDFYTNSHPRAPDVLLLIEVADSTLQTDRDIKVPLYARHDIPEVWIVDIRNRQILRFAHPKQGVYQTLETLDLRQPPALPGLPDCSVALAALFQ